MNIPIELTNDLKKGMRLDEALKKHNFCLKTAFEYMGYPKNNKSSENLYLIKDRWCIRKKIDGKITYFGTYLNHDDAKYVRDRLKECGWDKSLLPQIHKEMNYNPELRLAEKKPSRNIVKKSNGFYIQKHIDGKAHYYGFYHSLEDAQQVRNELILNNWDKSKLQQIKKELGVCNNGDNNSR